MRYLGGRWPLPAVLLLAIGLVLAGCGSDTPAEADLDPTTVPPPAASEQQPVSPTATPAAAAPPTGDSAPTTTPLIATPPPKSPDAPPAETATPRPSKPKSKPTPSPNRDLGYTERVTTTRAVDSRQRPTDSAAVFGEDERVYVSVEFLGVRSSAVLGVRWLRGSTESFVYEMEPTEAFSRGFFAFFFDPGGPGSAGPYGVEILINGEVVATASFEVRAGGGSGGPAG